ncbi:MAG: 16S rRNA (cytidine(1402)-2'-O)-methyltransferase [Pseudomonadota bacterium]
MATPIGTARDITLRALDTLASADMLVAEDTRVLRKLMEIHRIRREGRPMLAYHDHNGAAQRPKLLAALSAGKSIAYASDAGTPLVADPGFQLARGALDAGYAVHAVPGASAPLAALSVAGLPTDRFLFAGFAPTAGGARARWVREVGNVDATLVVFEAGRRVSALLGAFQEAGQGARPAAICRELTKKFEEVTRGSVEDLVQQSSVQPPKGEVVIVLGPPPALEVGEDDVCRALQAALRDKPLKVAAAEVAEATGWRKRDVYQLGVKLRE